MPYMYINIQELGGGGKLACAELLILFILLYSDNVTRLLPDSLKIPESNNNGDHSIDSMCLYGFSRSGRGGGALSLL